VIIVGQNVLAAAADKRSEATCNDADAVLHEAVKIQEHVAAARWTSPPLMAAMRKRRMAGAVAMSISPSRTTVGVTGSRGRVH
jgi:hypothetical protein